MNLSNATRRKLRESEERRTRGAARQMLRALKTFVQQADHGAMPIERDAALGEARAAIKYAEQVGITTEL